MKNRSFYSILALLALLSAPIDSVVIEEKYGFVQESPYDYPCLSLSYIDSLSMLKCSVVNPWPGQSKLLGRRLVNEVEFLENDRLIATYRQPGAEYEDHADRMSKTITRDHLFVDRFISPIAESSTTIKNFYLRFSSMSKLTGNYTCRVLGGFNTPLLQSNSIELTNRMSNEIFPNRKSVKNEVSVEERCGALIQTRVDFDIDKDEYVDDDTFYNMTCGVSFNKPINNYTVSFMHGPNAFHTIDYTSGQELRSPIKRFKFAHKLQLSDDFSKEFCCLVEIHNGHPTSRIIKISAAARIFPKVTVVKQTEVMVNENDTTGYKHKCVVNLHPVQANIPAYDVKLFSANDAILGSKSQRFDSVTVFDNIAETDGVYCRVELAGRFRPYYSDKAAAERAESNLQKIQDALDAIRRQQAFVIRID